MPGPRHGGLRTPRPWRSRGRRRTNRRRPGHPGRPLGRAKTATMLAHRGGAGSASAVRVASRCASAGERATAALVWPPPKRLQRVGREVAQGGAGLRPTGRPRVAASGIGVGSTGAGRCHASRATVPSGRHAQPGGARPSPGLSWGSNQGGPSAEALRRGHGPSVLRRVEGEDRGDGAPRRRGAWSSCQRINWPNSQPRPVVAHGQRGPAPGVACETAAAVASAAEEGRVQGRRGRRPRPGRDHAVHSRSGAATRRPRRARRRRPAPAAPSPMEAGDRRLGRALGQHGRGEGGAGHATTVRAAACADAEILPAYQEHNSTVDPGWRWSKHRAVSSPGWLEKPARIAALAMLTVVGLLV